MKKISFQKVFCLVSILFILGCCFFYGSRLIKYYKIYNPKTVGGSNVVYIGTSITSKIPLVIEGDGAYRISGNTVYKGEEVENYIMFSNVLWRIVKIKSDNTLVLISDDYLNILPWNSTYTEFSKSDILDYLNNVFINSLNKELLTKSTICEDSIKNTNSLSCENINVDSYVTLLDISDYLSSITDSKTYISSGTNKIWLANINKDNSKIWNTSGSGITYSDSTSNYLIKPVITISSSNILKGGTGTKTDPYVVKDDSKNVKAGSYVKLDKDIWQVYETSKDEIKLEAAELITTKKSFSSSSNIYNVETNNSLAKYLNTDYYNSLSYKDKLIKTNWYIGKLSKSYKDVINDKTTAYVGLLNRSDLKFDSSLINYYLSTPIDSKVYIYNSVLASSSVTINRQIRPTIAIIGNSKFKGSGTLEDPFTLEA